MITYSMEKVKSSACLLLVTPVEMFASEPLEYAYCEKRLISKVMQATIKLVNKKISKRIQTVNLKQHINISKINCGCF